MGRSSSSRGVSPMPFTYELPESWVRLGIAIAAVLAGILVLKILSRALARTPSAAGWLLARVGLAIVAFGLLMWTDVIPHEPAFPSETLNIAVGALVGGGMAFLLVGRAITAQAARSHTNVRVGAPVRPTPSTMEATMTLPPGGLATSRGSRREARREAAAADRR